MFLFLYSGFSSNFNEKSFHRMDNHATVIRVSSVASKCSNAIKLNVILTSFTSESLLGTTSES